MEFVVVLTMSLVLTFRVLCIPGYQLLIQLLLIGKLGLLIKEIMDRITWFLPIHLTIQLGGIMDMFITQAWFTKLQVHGYLLLPPHSAGGLTDWDLAIKFLTDRMNMNIRDNICYSLITDTDNPYLNNATIITAFEQAY